MALPGLTGPAGTQETQRAPIRTAEKTTVTVTFTGSPSEEAQVSYFQNGTETETGRVVGGSTHRFSLPYVSRGDSYRFTRGTNEINVTGQDILDRVDYLITKGGHPYMTNLNFTLEFDPTKEAQEYNPTTNEGSNYKVLTHFNDQTIAFSLFRHPCKAASNILHCRDMREGTVEDPLVYGDVPKSPVTAQPGGPQGTPEQPGTGATGTPEQPRTPPREQQGTGATGTLPDNRGLQETGGPQGTLTGGQPGTLTRATGTPPREQQGTGATGTLPDNRGQEGQPGATATLPDNRGQEGQPGATATLPERQPRATGTQPDNRGSQGTGGLPGTPEQLGTLPRGQEGTGGPQGTLTRGKQGTDQFKSSLFQPGQSEESSGSGSEEEVTSGKTIGDDEKGPYGFPGDREYILRPGGRKPVDTSRKQPSSAESTPTLTRKQPSSAESTPTQTRKDLSSGKTPSQLASTTKSRKNRKPKQ